MTKRKHILVDGRIFTLQSKGGVSQMWAYILGSESWQRRIATHLLVYPGHEKNIHLVEGGILDGNPEVHVIRCAIPPSDNGNFVSAKYAEERRRAIASTVTVPIEAVLNTYYGENVFPDCQRYIVTALDFAHEELPNLRSKPSTAVVLQQKQIAFKQATQVSFISNASRQCFFKHYSWYDRRQTRVIYLGHDVSFPDTVKVRDLLIHVGTRGGYKNFSIVSDSVEQVMARNMSLRFFILGGEPSDQTIQNLQHRFPGRVRFNPMPSDREMDHAMATAAVFVSASLYEGFGIPLLNALRLGTHPVVSDIPVYREIAGSHAFFFPATSSSQLASAIEKALAAEPIKNPFYRSWDDVARDYVRMLSND